MTLGVNQLGTTAVGDAVATVSIIQASQCGTGGHKTVTVSLSGGQSRTVEIHKTEFSDPITDEEIATFAKLSIRLHKIGKTVAQTEADLVAGFTVTA